MRNLVDDQVSGRDLCMLVMFLLVKARLVVGWSVFFYLPPAQKKVERNIEEVMSSVYKQIHSVPE